MTGGSPRRGPLGYAELKAYLVSPRLCLQPLIFETEPGTDRRRITDLDQVPRLFTRYLVALANPINIMQIMAAR
jgi:hypothetical protein